MIRRNSRGCQTMNSTGLTLSQINATTDAILRLYDMEIDKSCALLDLDAERIWRESRGTPATPQGGGDTGMVLSPP